MKTGFGRLAIGLIFVFLGGSRLANSQSKGLAIFGGLMLLYGLFSIGHGIYLMSKKPSPELNEVEQDNDDEIS